MSESSREWGKFRPILQPLPEIELAKLVEILQQRGFLTTEAQEAAELIRDRDAWYYRIQFPSNLWTTTFRFESVAITRTLLSRAGLRGASLLDIGTMEGMIPMLARAAGANHVVGYDRPNNRRNRVGLIQRVYGREFEHSTGQSLVDFRDQSDEQFDVVVFSGVLYHMFDPLGGLALAASFAKPGGLLIFESSAVVREDCACISIGEDGTIRKRTSSSLLRTRSIIFSGLLA